MDFLNILLTENFGAADCSSFEEDQVAVVKQGTEKQVTTHATPGTNVHHALQYVLAN